MPYQEVIYTIAVLVFTTNMLAGVIMKASADKKNTAAARQLAFRNIIRSDIWITIPSLLAILLCNAQMNAGRTLGIFNLVLLVPVVMSYSILLFAFIINPLRTSLYNLSRSGDKTFDAGIYEKLSRKWVTWGIIELAPLVGLLLYSLVF